MVHSEGQTQVFNHQKYKITIYQEMEMSKNEDVHQQNGSLSNKKCGYSLN